MRPVFVPGTVQRLQLDDWSNRIRIDRRQPSSRGSSRPACSIPTWSRHAGGFDPPPASVPARHRARLARRGPDVARSPVAPSPPEEARPGCLGQFVNRHDLRPRVQRVASRAGVDHDEPAEPQIRHRAAHRCGQLRGVGALDLDAVPAAAPEEEQVQPGAAVRAPEVRLVWSQSAQNLLDDVTFPRGAELRMAQQVGMRANPQQVMEEPGVAQIGVF